MGALKFKIVVFVDLGSISNYKAATYIVQGLLAHGCETWESPQGSWKKSKLGGKSLHLSNFDLIKVVAARLCYGSSQACVPSKSKNCQSRQ